MKPLIYGGLKGPSRKVFTRDNRIEYTDSE